jgi:hypothetical protein
MRNHTTHTRDAALRDLHRMNRWMIAGSVLLTGVLSDVAAHAFPGKTVKAKTSAKAPSSTPTKHHSSTSTGVLKPPDQAPKTSTEATPPQEAGSSESAPAHESAPAPESSPAPAQESAPAQEPAPPVVSGGS